MKTACAYSDRRCGRHRQRLLRCGRRYARPAAAGAHDGAERAEALCDLGDDHSAAVGRLGRGLSAARRRVRCAGRALSGRRGCGGVLAGAVLKKLPTKLLRVAFALFLVWGGVRLLLR